MKLLTCKWISLRPFVYLLHIEPIYDVSWYNDIVDLIQSGHFKRQVVSSITSPLSAHHFGEFCYPPLLCSNFPCTLILFWRKLNVQSQLWLHIALMFPKFWCIEIILETSSESLPQLCCSICQRPGLPAQGGSLPSLWSHFKAKNIKETDA
jgi:hypothetical protein